MGKMYVKELLDFNTQDYYFKLLYNLTFKYATTTNIIKQFTLANPNHMNLLIHYFKQHALKYQYVYSNLFPKYFCRVDNYSLKEKSEFDCAFKEWKSSKQPKFDFNIQKIEAAQEQTEVLIKIDKFPPFTLIDKEINRINKREEKKQALLQNLKTNDMKMNRIKYNK